ncbi:hypothetical protein [Longispora albida]|uniref:hypothetical protein n=1 Tax=Longispora albida TaxID=203523 RepID=UPI00036F2F46|nr:hypothetical protein [Longispora albida]
MRRLLAATLAAAALTISLVTLAAPAPARAQVSDLALAQRWAPVHYQDTDSTDYDADYLSAVDYDGEWDTLNNWEHEPSYPLLGTVSYSVVETSTHWFIVYGFYHPRDWCDSIFCGEHENDMEGVLLTIRRDGSTYGRFEAMVTVAHSDFYSFVPPGSAFVSGRESVDGSVIMQTANGYARPTTRQEAKGHGVKAWDGKEFPGGDGVVYYPSGTAEIPSGGNDRSVGYRLVGVFDAGGLWARRYDAQTFASWGTFRGDNGSDNAANAPWGWDDGNDGSDLQRGLLATDPAKLVTAYFNGEGTFGLAYTRNGYR